MKSNIKNGLIEYMKFNAELYGNGLLLDNMVGIEFKAPETKIAQKEILKEEVIIKPKIQSTLPPQATESKLSIGSKWKFAATLDELDSQINTCVECPLGATRIKFVFGTGNPNADIMVIGEAPGADEDEQGKPFVGRAGQLLTKILESINLSREEVFIANIIKCRPPGNRRPVKEEVDKCELYLKKQIDLIKPAFILSLGLTSVDTLLKKTHKMSEIRGKVLDYHNIKMITTYHPAALLRNPNWKQFVWDDVRFLRKLYDEYLLNSGK
ncbi:MAG: uracil-DNA glycosylase [Ignavibacteriae bacterium HGW-Ignavibacteriae-1]|jgi:DNA polymerase|nr:MAG: uracil-DNA glycosylase [Ignavibacteriae bacterium HGW-Ignavibacteriae-1]